jgi:hypothetical protein
VAVCVVHFGQPDKLCSHRDKGGGGRERMWLGQANKHLWVLSQGG